MGVNVLTPLIVCEFQLPFWIEGIFRSCWISWFFEGVEVNNSKDYPKILKGS